ncbi:arabinosyltransferase domain-containing protein [Williamsia sterculiae]|uniref:Arabinosyltransferase B n=1 Tax=Williamsia sterculiae TaxID=1344003 RepID=A0A1N7HB25_9NOCA|nr:arabinosyltransferase domain-containing protein [Williamsia sterculiae]SIS22084.1 arabinosyltransferase B [Williamsia sterculiae]
MTDSVTTTPPPATPPPATSSSVFRRPPSDVRFRWAKIVAVVTGLLGLLLACLSPLLPVNQSTADLQWPQQGRIGSVNAPLAAFVPIDLDVRTACAPAAQTGRDGGVLLSTVPKNGQDASSRGLFVKTTTDRLQLTVRDVVLLTIPRAEAQSTPGCTIVVHADGTGMRASVQGVGAGSDGSDQTSFDVKDPNLRPQITGVYTDLPATTSPDAMSVHATIDTRYVTTPTTLKFWALVIGIVSTLISLVALAVLDSRDGRRHQRFLPVGWWRIRPLDAIVFVILAAWWLIGANTSDDGYIFTVARITSDAGYADNYYRYFGVPQDPFGWHSQLFSLMTHVSLAAPWMRLPAFLLGVLGWWLISREVIPRLGNSVRASTPALWSAAFVMLAVWLPLNNGLRPEPFIAVGAILTWCCVERAVATGRFLPLAVATISAAFTLALAPGGLIAVAALLAGIRPLLTRLMARRERDGLLPLLAPLLASGTAVLFLVFGDQTLSTILTAYKVASQVGPTLEWWQEPIRFYYLMLPTADGSLARRFGVLIVFLCLAVVLLTMLRRRMPRGVAKGPIWRLIAVMFGTMFFMAFTPTKWTHHLGVYACVGAGLAAAAGAMMAPAMLRRRRNRTFFAAAVLFITGLAFTGQNVWWFVGSYGVPWWDRPPSLGGIGFGNAIMVIGVIVALVGLWQHFRDDYVDQDVRDGQTGLLSRVHVSPLAVVAALVVAFEVLSLAKGAYVQRHSFSWTTSNVRALQGNVCGLANDVLVERDPNAGLLQPARVAGQNSPTPGDALAGASMTGFTPNGIPNDLSLDSTVDQDSTSQAQNTAQNSAGSSDTESESSQGGINGGQGARGVNGSTARLPFGLSPARTPVLGSYGSSSAGSLTSDWYQMPTADASRPLLSVSVAGAVQAVNGQGVAQSGQKLVMQFGRVGADGAVTPTGTMSPLDIGPQPTWRNLRFPLDRSPRGSSVVRIVASDTGTSTNQWLAVTPPRISTMRTLEDVVGRTDPVLIDWLPAFVFPCQRPMGVKYGVVQVPQWRILPDADATRRNSQTWMSGDAGGPLGLTEAMLSPTLLPTYLRNDWGRDWGALQRFTQLQPAPTAQLQLGNATRSGLWDPAPMRSVGY